MKAPPSFPVPGLKEGEPLGPALERAPRHALVAVDGAPLEPPTTLVALLHDDAALHALFLVRAEPPLRAAVTRPGGPVYEDECVELFLAAASSPPLYQEIVVNPLGTIYGARVYNPDDSRATWRLSPGVVPEGLEVVVTGTPEHQPPASWETWRCRISVPWTSLPDGVLPTGEELLGNLFRIGRGRSTSFEALSPTGRSRPPDFHVPSRFARLILMKIG